MYYVYLIQLIKGHLLPNIKKIYIIVWGGGEKASSRIVYCRWVWMGNRSNCTNCKLKLDNGQREWETRVSLEQTTQRIQNTFLAFLQSNMFWKEFKSGLYKLICNFNSIKRKGGQTTARVVSVGVFLSHLVHFCTMEYVTAIWLF